MLSVPDQDVLHLPHGQPQPLASLGVGHALSPEPQNFGE
jgi:hypothetical protein